MVKHCPTCGNEFEGATQKKFCGVACRNKVSNDILNAQRRQNRKDFFAANPVPCKQCGVEFIRANGGQKYCNADCRIVALEANRMIVHVSPEQKPKVKQFIKELRANA